MTPLLAHPLRSALHRALPPARRLAALALSSALMSLAGAAHAQPRYALTPLGVLPGYATCTPMAVGDSGDVVGSCMPAVEDYTKQRAFLWRGGQMSALGVMSKGSYSVATAISGTGVIAGDGNTGSIRPQGWLRKSGALEAFFPNNGGNTHVTGIGDTGWIGGYTIAGSTSGPWEAAVWTPDAKDPRKYRQTLLPTLPVPAGGSVSQTIAERFNQSGQAVGHTMNSAIGQHAVFWTSAAQRSAVDLGVYPGDASSLAFGLNDLGHAVGTSYRGTFNRAVIWANDAGHTISQLPPLVGDNGGSAKAINNAGHIIGTSYRHSFDGTPMPAPRTVVWRDGQVFALDTVLDASAGTGWQVTEVQALNQRGQIVGQAMRAGVRHAVLLTPLN